MAVRQRVDKSFEVTGPITMIRSGLNKSGQVFVLVAVAGISFFLPEELHEESKLYEEGQRVTVHGEYGGRNGNNPILDVFEITIPGLGKMPTFNGVPANGVSKGQPA